MHPDNPKWECTFIRVSNERHVGVLDTEGKADIVPEQRHFVAVLTDFGRQVWELVQGGPNADSSGSTYILKPRL